jgi:peptide/nickel transport system ATP-binding protein
MQDTTQFHAVDPLLKVEDLVVEYGVGGRTIHAVSGVSLQIARGETLGLVGESGCGKSTLGRAVLQLRPAVSGRVLFDGEDLTAMRGDALRRMRRRVQLIFQDPIASLNPRRRIGDIVAEPLVIAGYKDAGERQALVEEVLNAVGLDPTVVSGRLPHEFSGGQCQRIGIARAMINNPKLVVCDEPVSALDVSIQAQIVNLLMDLQQEFGMSMIFISHNLSVVRHISHRIMVLYLGRVAELASRDQLYRNPRHPYTQALISAVPIPDPDLERQKQRIVLSGDLPSPLHPPSGCVFRTRCPKATDICARVVPELLPIESGHYVACHHWDE